jgi:hypothetical protein
MFLVLGCGYCPLGSAPSSPLRRRRSLSERDHLAVLVEADGIGEAVFEARAICRALKIVGLS